MLLCRMNLGPKLVLSDSKLSLLDMKNIALVGVFGIFTENISSQMMSFLMNILPVV